MAVLLFAWVEKACLLPFPCAEWCPSHCHQIEPQGALRDCVEAIQSICTVRHEGPMMSDCHNNSCVLAHCFMQQAYASLTGVSINTQYFCNS